MAETIEIYTDGACSGNPGPGGWAAILSAHGVEKIISGGVLSTTNNRMELTAALEALKCLKRPCGIRLYSDSAYLVSAFVKGWLAHWQKNGWRNSAGDPVSNPDLWQALLQMAAPHTIEWIKVKGHADHAYNNRCDQLAVAEIKKIRLQTEKKPPASEAGKPETTAAAEEKG
ncbi:MAG: ribonuclease HI [Clostridiaceae bacterium]|nr:ribonuclease HI [Clostridiaceae bacterium]